MNLTTYYDFFTIMTDSLVFWMSL